MKTKGHIKTDIFSNKTNIVFTFTIFLIIVNYCDIPMLFSKKKHYNGEIYIDMRYNNGELFSCRC